MNVTEIIGDSLMLLFCSIFLGQLIGKINYKGFKLGSAGALFSGIIISYLSTKYLLVNDPNNIILQGNIIHQNIFQLSLTGFIGSVGLLASQKIKGQIRKNGYKFMLLALTITGVGAVTTFLFINISSGLSKISIIGTYPGALTSSPALATAMELAMELGSSQETLVGLGYTISYIPAVTIIVLFVQILGKKVKAENILKEKFSPINTEVQKSNFNIISFAVVCMVGSFLGSIEVNLGSYLGEFSLGATGGVLISSLVLGNIKKIGFLNFDMDNNQMAIIRDISLNIFFATVGLNYGYSALDLIRVSGIQLLILGSFTTFISIGAGYLVGSKVLKLSLVNIIGAICGSMTSTPGLCAAMESVDSDEVVTGYGGAYPFGLFFKIVFINILFRI